MTTDLEFGKVPGGIFVSWTLDVSERRLIGCNVAVDVERYLNFVLRSGPGQVDRLESIRTLQELMSLVPIHTCFEVHVRSSVRPQGRWR